MKRLKLFRITTYPISFRCLLKGQAYFFSNFFDVTIISNTSNELFDIASKEGVKGIGIPMTRAITPILDFISLVKMIILFLKNKPDIVHTHTPKAGLIGMLAACITRCPKRLHTVAGLPLIASTGLKREILILVEKLTYYCATEVIPNSRGLYDFILKNKFCKEKKLNFLEPGSSNGIDLTYFSRDNVIESSEKIRETLGFTSEHFVYIFAGRIVRDKGITELVDAFCAISETHPNARLLIIGDFDHGLQPILEETKEILLNKSEIKLAGFQEDVRPYILAADILVLPSYREGLPQILLQACALDTPCIATNIIGCEDIINKENGILIEAKSVSELETAMRNVIDGKSDLSYWKNNARKSILKFSQTNIWNSLLEIYEK